MSAISKYNTLCHLKQSGIKLLNSNFLCALTDIAINTLTTVLLLIHVCGMNNTSQNYP
mgnify:CR=1 FL=1